MDSSNSFERTTELIEDEVRVLEKELKIDSLKMDENLSKVLPNNYIKLSAKSNIARLSVLKERMEDGSITDGEMEEYGWRIINQK